MFDVDHGGTRDERMRWAASFGFVQMFELQMFRALNFYNFGLSLLIFLVQINGYEFILYWWLSIKKWMGPYQRTLRKLLSRAIRYSGLGVRSVGPVRDFLEIWFSEKPNFFWQLNAHRSRLEAQRSFQCFSFCIVRDFASKKNLSCHCLWGSEEPKNQSRRPKTVRPFVDQYYLAFSHSNLCQLRGFATLQKKRNGMRLTALVCHPFRCIWSVEKRAEATCVIHHSNLVEIGTFEHNAPLSTSFRITMFVQRHRSLCVGMFVNPITTWHEQLKDAVWPEKQPITWYKSKRAINENRKIGAITMKLFPKVS